MRIPISLLASSCPLFFLGFSLVYRPVLFQTHSSNQTCGLSSLFSTIHTLSLCSPPPINLRNISELTGYFVAMNVVARGPAGGRCSLGTGSVLKGQRL